MGRLWEPGGSILPAPDSQSQSQGVNPLVTHCLLQLVVKPEAGVLDIELPAAKGA